MTGSGSGQMRDSFGPLTPNPEGEPADLVCWRLGCAQSAASGKKCCST